MKTIPKHFVLQRAIAMHLRDSGVAPLPQVQSALRSMDSPSHIESALNIMIRRGWVELVDQKYQLSKATAESLAEESESAPPLQIVPPRVIDKMHSTLSPKYIPSQYGTRPEAPRREYRQISMASNVQPTQFYGVPA